MIRLILLLLCITGLSLGITWIADEPGRAAIEWGAYHIETSPLVILAGTATLALVCMVIYVLLFAIVRSPQSWSRAQTARRQTLGLEALTHAFSAIATQDIRSAKKYIGQAQQYLPHQPLTLMLSAQAARLEGNDSKARLYLEQMLKDESTEFMALRALIETARRNHDDAAILQYGEKAIQLNPKDEWLIMTMVGVHVRQGDAQTALRLLERSAKKRYISHGEMRRQSAYVLYENARTLTGLNRLEFAISILEDVLRKLPGFAPASSLLAHIYIKRGDGKRALKVLDTNWKIAPHPDLSSAVLACYDADLERKRIVTSIEKLAVKYPNDRETQLLSAELAIRRNTPTPARNTLELLVHEDETVRVCALMAEVETITDNPEKASFWLKRGASADADPSWACETCNHTEPTWFHTCSQCGSVASAVWK